MKWFHEYCIHIFIFQVADTPHFCSDPDLPPLRKFLECCGTSEKSEQMIQKDRLRQPIPGIFHPVSIFNSEAPVGNRHG
jgi:hypothetical protein